MKILGIETSCDETGVAVIEGGSSEIKLLSNSLASSLPLHSKTGGIIPENAAREQVKFIIPVLKDALQTAKLEMKDIDAIAVTFGPGLIGSLLVGVETAKTLSYTFNKPLIPVNHLLGHIYANFINQESEVKFPVLGLIISGAHTDLVVLKSHKDLIWVGGTRDDAAGECFDKCARLLGYDYPGGPKIARLGELGNPKAFQFPRPMIGSNDFDFSFSGLKTAFLSETKKNFPVLRINPGSKIGWQQVILEERLSKSEKQTLYDLCASLEEAIIDVIVKKTMRAAEKYGVKSVLLGGGVAANTRLRSQLKQEIETQNLKLFVPPKTLCTDNGAMIAASAFYNKTQESWQNVDANPNLYFQTG